MPGLESVVAGQEGLLLTVRGDWRGHSCRLWGVMSSRECGGRSVCCGAWCWSVGMVGFLNIGRFSGIWPGSPQAVLTGAGWCGSHLVSTHGFLGFIAVIQVLSLL